MFKSIDWINTLLVIAYLGCFVCSLCLYAMYPMWEWLALAFTFAVLSVFSARV